MIPTEKQYNYAWQIAHALKIELPQFFNRFAFCNFITEHKPNYDQLIASYNEAYDEAKYEQIIQDSIKFSS